MAGLVPAIHVLANRKKGVDARVKPGHDESVGRLTSRRGFHRSRSVLPPPGSVLPPPERGRVGVGVKLQSEGSFRAWGRDSILSASSWPGLSRPSTSWQI